MPPEIRRRCFELKCRSKEGRPLSKEDQAFLLDCFNRFPKEYGAMEKEVFEATKPFGA